MLFLMWVALSPLLWLTGRWVRWRMPRLPEADGERSGVAGSGPVRLRLLIVGDSSAAGVGVERQEDALAGQLARALVAQGYSAVSWQLVARTGDTVGSAIEHLASVDLRRADMLVTVLGVNDCLDRVSARDYLGEMDALVSHVQTRTGVLRVVHCTPPRMELMPGLPQPLRFVLGAQAAHLDQALRRHVLGFRRRTRFDMPLDLARDASLYASDGFHPGADGYVRWAAALAEHIDVDIHTSAESRAARPSGFYSGLPSDFHGVLGQARLHSGGGTKTHARPVEMSTVRA